MNPDRVALPDSGTVWLGTFAGYVVSGRPTTRIAASWRVPRIAPAAPPGSNATWIGVQRPAGGLSPFIQVGTIGFRNAAGRDEYKAFWSDTAKGFEPITMLRVREGDRISTSLVRFGDAWMVQVVDHTSGTARRVVTEEEASAVLDQAEWLQEDPGIGSAAGAQAHVPYASTEPVKFSGLRLDGHPPPVGQSLPQWMSLPDANLVPSPLHHDAFSLSLRRHALSREATVGVETLAPLAQADAWMIGIATHWSTRTPPARIAAILRAVSSAHGSGPQTPGYNPWPQFSGAITRFADDYVNQTMLSAHVPRKGFEAWRSTLVTTAHALVRADRHLLRLIGAPEIVATN